MFLRVEGGENVYRLADIEEIFVEFDETIGNPPVTIGYVRATINEKKVDLSNGRRRGLLEMLEFITAESARGGVDLFLWSAAHPLLS